MDFSEYTLVSFGDSFTFGQGSTLNSDLIKIKKELLAEGDRKTDPRSVFKTVSNIKSYTKFLEKLMNFKDSVNMGIPGSGNKRTYQLIKDFHRQNKESDNKFFYIINLSHASRDLIMSRNIVTDKFESYDFIFNNWEKDISRPKGKQFPQEIHDLKLKSFADIAKYYRNDYTVLSDYVSLYEDIINFLELNSIPYVIFDILNDMNFHIMEFNLLENIGVQVWADLCLTDNKYYEFMDLKSTIHNHISMIKHPDSKLLSFLKYREMDYYVNTKVPIDHDGYAPTNMARYVERHPGKLSVNSPVEGDDHWSVSGHMLAAELIEYWIRKHYE